MSTKEAFFAGWDCAIEYAARSPCHSENARRVRRLTDYRHWQKIVDMRDAIRALSPSERAKNLGAALDALKALRALYTRTAEQE